MIDLSMGESMQSTFDRRETSSRPRDRSLDSYKAWIRDIASRLITDSAALTLTDQEWIESWKEYWKQKSQDA